MPEERTYTDEEIDDLTDRVFLLRERVEQGQLGFATEQLKEDFFRSYSRISLLPDGRVDPKSLDGRIRTSTLAMRAMKYRQDSKSEISLAQIQDAYFTLLFREFGWLFEQMQKAGANPAAAGRIAARDAAFVEHAVEVLPKMVEDLKEFWQAVGDGGAFHLQDQQTLKATFAGDLFPAYWENAVSTAGLYVDTIILPCPIMRTAPMIASNMPRSELVAVLLKHVLTAMTYREVAIADVSPPIALVMPNTGDIDTESRRGLVERAKPLMVKHASYLFGRDFESVEHIGEFCDSLSTVEKALAELKGGDRLVFDAEWGSGPREQLNRVLAEKQPGHVDSDPEHPGHHILSSVLGRMPQAMATEDNAFHFGGTPLINAQTSWLYYTWMLDYQAAPVPTGHRGAQSMHIVRALSAESGNNLAWLGNVPPETVLEIRRNGLAEEVRALLDTGVSDLIKANPSNYFRTADQVVENLDKAFRKHQQALLEARNKKLKLYGVDVTSMLATGVVAVAGAVTGNVALGAISGVLGVVGLPNLREIKSKFAEIAAEDKARRASPTGLLFRHLS